MALARETIALNAAAGLIELDPGLADTPPPAGAIEHLKANPSLAAEFDSKYGAGQARRYLNR